MSSLTDWLGLPQRGPKALAFRPEPLWIGDAAAARRMLSGRFRFAGREVSARELGPWRLTPPSPDFAEELHAFAWLDDLAAAGTREARRAAQSWTFGWIAAQGEAASGPAAAPDVMGRRVIHWLERAEFLLKDASADLERRFIKSLSLQERRLRKGVEAAPRGLPRLRAAAGALHAALALHAAEAPRQAAARRLAAVASETIDADGGLASRNPQELCEALILLAVAARHLEGAGMEPTEGHARAVARVQTALRALRLRDGGLPRFHGGGAGAPGRLEHALSLAHPRKSPPARERAMGFVRLAAGRLTVVVDAAAPPATTQAHAATLAFELAAGGTRLICNCGPAAHLGGDWAAACRATAAQSTLALEGVSSSRISPSAKGAGPHPFVQRPAHVEAETAQDTEGHWFLGAHDGWLGSHGLIHRRRLYLSLDGRDFRGEDVLEAPNPRARAAWDKLMRARRRDPGQGLIFALHFHLAPEAEPEHEGGGAVSIAIGADRWRFTAVGGDVEIAPSVHFAPEATEPDATKQIVVTARALDYGGRVSWGLRRAAGS